jgi:hypothetical protein
LTHGSGYIQTSVLSQGGRPVPIEEALPSERYDGLYTGSASVSSKWAGQQSFSSKLSAANGYYQESYIEGAAAGGVSLTAPVIVAQGDMWGRSIIGPRQRETPPALGSLKLSFSGEKNVGSVTAPVFVNASPFAPEFRLVAGRALTLNLPEFELVNGEPLTLPANLRSTFTLGGSIFDKVPIFGRHIGKSTNAVSGVTFRDFLGFLFLLLPVWEGSSYRNWRRVTSP